jgi:hypothetical protein
VSRTHRPTCIKLNQFFAKLLLREGSLPFAIRAIELAHETFSGEPRGRRCEARQDHFHSRVASVLDVCFVRRVGSGATAGEEGEDRGPGPEQREAVEE